MQKPRANQLYKTKTKMGKQKAKFQLFIRLEAMGFTYDESVALRRIDELALCA